MSNLSKREQRGLRKLKKRIKEGEIIVLKTDKSGKLIVMDKEKYLKLGKEKNEQDREIKRRELREIETKINAQTKF